MLVAESDPLTNTPVEFCSALNFDTCLALVNAGFLKVAIQAMYVCREEREGGREGGREV